MARLLPRASEQAIAERSEEQIMESRAKLVGHAVHPMLIVFPLGLLGMAAIFDLIHLFAGGTGLSAAAYYMLPAGVVTGLVAAVFGLVDWLAIPEGTRAKAVGLWHGVGNVVVVALFALSWWLRPGDAPHAPGTTAVLFSVVGVVLALVTGWLGGELVERLGIGVDEGANPDAPSSLSGDARARTV
jgi:uncharacterized membrane protein